MNKPQQLAAMQISNGTRVYVSTTKEDKSKENYYNA